MSSPNLFHYATSELSQDAVLCWLLAWAGDSCRDIDKELHAASLAFVKMLFDRAKIDPPPEPLKLEVRRQWHHTDILALIGEKHAIVIEDKIHAHEHGKQLDDYHEKAIKEFPNRKIAFIYLKTGDEASHQIENWHSVKRRDLLESLSPFKSSICNAIFTDFVDHLQAREDAVLSFRTRPLDDWTHPRSEAMKYNLYPHPYKGFYAELQGQLKASDWRYVANPNGGFWGFWWGFVKLGAAGKIYLQIEETNLVVKIAVNEAGERRKVRDFWSELVREELDGFEKPKRLGYGRTMTIAVRESYLATSGDGTLDLGATIETLKDCTRQFSQLVQKQLAG